MFLMIAFLFFFLYNEIVSNKNQDFEENVLKTWQQIVADAYQKLQNLEDLQIQISDHVRHLDDIIESEFNQRR